MVRTAHESFFFYQKNERKGQRTVIYPLVGSIACARGNIVRDMVNIVREIDNIDHERVICLP